MPPASVVTNHWYGELRRHSRHAHRETSSSGHEKGAVHGRDDATRGPVRARRRRTIFSTKWASAAELQSKLFRVLQEGTFEPVGGTTTAK